MTALIVIYSLIGVILIIGGFIALRLAQKEQDEKERKRRK